MTCLRDIMDEEALEREFDSIRKVFRNLKKSKLLPMRIEWGTKEAFLGNLESKNMKEWIVKVIKVDQISAKTENEATEIVKDHLQYKGINPKDFIFRTTEVQVG